MNILIKLTSIVALIIAPHIAVDKDAHQEQTTEDEIIETEHTVQAETQEPVAAFAE